MEKVNDSEAIQDHALEIVGRENALIENIKDSALCNILRADHLSAEFSKEAPAQKGFEFIFFK